MACEAGVWHPGESKADEEIENGMQAEKRKQQQFLELAERFRNEKDPEAASRLGDELGRMVFGG